MWWQAGERGRAHFTLAFVNGNLAVREGTDGRGGREGFERRGPGEKKRK